MHLCFVSEDLYVCKYTLLTRTVFIGQEGTNDYVGEFDEVIDEDTFKNESRTHGEIKSIFA